MHQRLPKHDSIQPLHHLASLLLWHFSPRHHKVWPVAGHRDTPIQPRCCSLDSFKNMKTAKSACDSDERIGPVSPKFVLIMATKSTYFRRFNRGQYAADWWFGILLLRLMVELARGFGIGSGGQPKYQPVDQYPCPLCLLQVWPRCSWSHHTTKEGV